MKCCPRPETTTWTARREFKTLSIQPGSDPTILLLHGIYEWNLQARERRRAQLTRAGEFSSRLGVPLAICTRTWLWRSACSRGATRRSLRLFYHKSAAAAKLMGRRAILLARNAQALLPELPEGVVAFDYAPFSLLFPRAAAIVHHGGIGTTGQAMRSGRPSLVMPCAWDQPDNAERAARLGIARTIARSRYEPHRVAAELRLLLEDTGYSQRASEVAAKVRQEQGVKAACDAIESLFQNGNRLAKT